MTRASGKLTCVSCNPSGAPATSAAYLAGNLLSLAGEPRNAFLTRNLSDDGNRVFFQTKKRSCLQDTNEQTDVYEWEREGTGGADGCALERELQRKLRRLPLSDLHGTERRSVLLRRCERRWRRCLLLHPPVARGPGSGRQRRPLRRARRRRDRRPEPAARGSCTGEGCLGPAGSPPVFDAPVKRDIRGGSTTSCP